MKFSQYTSIGNFKNQKRHGFKPFLYNITNSSFFFVQFRSKVKVNISSEKIRFLKRFGIASKNS